MLLQYYWLCHIGVEESIDLPRTSVSPFHLAAVVLYLMYLIACATVCLDDAHLVFARLVLQCRPYYDPLLCMSAAWMEVDLLKTGKPKDRADSFIT